MILETFLDGLLLALCGLSLLGRGRRKMLDWLLPLAYTVLCFLTQKVSMDPMDYLVMPTDNCFYVLLLFIFILMWNSLWCQVQEGHILWGSTAQLALYLLLRWVCTAGLELVLGRGPLVVFGVRILSTLLWLVLQWSGLLDWLRARLADGDAIARAASVSTLLLLVLLWAIQIWQPIQSLHLLPITAMLLSILVLVDGLFFLWDQRQIQERQQVRLMEQYLPMVEELVESVRARQHEFNNRMIAVSAAISTADTLEGAREAVSAMVERIALDKVERELLRCDSKVISGMLFGKIKQAELRHIQVEVSVTGAFLHRSLSESDWVEVIGVLLDNALEASEADSTIYLRAADEDGMLRLTVSNPYCPKSNVELAEMFRRGWSTKTGQGRGYGLYNVRRLIEQHSGRLIARNEEIGGENFLTIGVLIE